MTSIYVVQYEPTHFKKPMMTCLRIEFNDPLCIGKAGHNQLIFLFLIQLDVHVDDNPTSSKWGPRYFQPGFPPQYEKPPWWNLKFGNSFRRSLD